jgi:hypothetical protein
MKNGLTCETTLTPGVPVEVAQLHRLKIPYLVAIVTTSDQAQVCSVSLPGD